MKLLSKIIFFSSLLGMSISSLAQYVSLEGRQFKLNGTDFYPVICNYGFAATFNTGGAYYMSPNNSYGEGFSCAGCDPLPNYDFDNNSQNDCITQIHNELTRIRDMGFNAIRTYGLAPFKSDPNKAGVIGFNVKAFENIHPIWNSTTQLIPITPTPYAYDNSLNTNVQLLFSWYDMIFQEAQTCGLKVLLDVVYDDIAAHPTNVTDYADYLMALADRYKNNTTLMAYVVIEEPSYNLYNVGHTKQEICNITTQWYDAIKSKDQNHLITMGGSYVLDALEWDPGVMKLDFYCPHIYPDFKDYENYSITNSFDRVLGNLLWITNNSPMPWVIGETGFSAYDDYYYNPSHTPQTISSPAVNGTISEQATYGQFILDAVRNTNGSGISWWNFEHWWGSNLPQEDGLGLLRHGPLTDPNIEKPVTQAFRNYPVPPPNPVSVNTPSNYNNPYNLISSPYTYTGTVLDEATSNGVKDALIFAWIYFYETNPIPPYAPIYKEAFVYSIGDGNGNFTLHTANPNAITNDPFFFPFIIKKIGITTASAERETYGIWGINPLPGNNIINCNLKLSPFNFDLQVSNEIIDVSNSPRNYKGWNTLAVSDVSVLTGGISDMKAKKEVSIQSEFHAEAGSEVHIYCEPSIFSDCSVDVNGFLRMANNSTTETNSSYSEKEIEIDFSPKTTYTYVELKPNPNSGIFTVEIKTNHQETLKNQIRVINLLGNIIYQTEMTENISALNLSSIAKGIYYVQIRNQFSSFNQKIIIQ